jgi:hypothetical protein
VERSRLANLPDIMASTLRFSTTHGPVPYGMGCSLIAKVFTRLHGIHSIVFSFLEYIIGSRLRVEAHAMQGVKCGRINYGAYSFNKFSVMSDDW